MMCEIKTDGLLIVIPARGGSRGIPRKPLAEAYGRPLLWYTLDYVNRLGFSVQSVVVTDDDEIAAYTYDAGHGAGVIREPTVTSRNENSIRAVYRAVRQVEEGGHPIDRVVVLQPTQPVRPLDVVDRCLAALGNGADASLTVHEPATPPNLMAAPDETTGLLRYTDYRRRQDCPKLYRANGLCYAYQRTVFNEEPRDLPSFHRQRTYRPVPTEPFPFVDIDEPHDLEWFAFLVKHGHTIWLHNSARVLPLQSTVPGGDDQ